MYLAVRACQLLYAHASFMCLTRAPMPMLTLGLKTEQRKGREGKRRERNWTWRLRDLPRTGVEMNDKMEGRDGSSALQAVGVCLLCMVRDLKAWGGHKKTGTLRKTWSWAAWLLFTLLGFIYFFIDCCMNLIPHFAPAFLLIFLPLLYLPIQTWWHALGKCKGYFVPTYTDAAMFQISDVNIADEFLRGDS